MAPYKNLSNCLKENWGDINNHLSHVFALDAMYKTGNTLVFKNIWRVTAFMDMELNVLGYVIILNCSLVGSLLLMNTVRV